MTTVRETSVSRYIYIGGDLVQHQEGFFHNAAQTEIFYQSWRPATASKAALVLVHGVTEHSGRYDNVVNHFVPLGYAVYAHDHVGHGRSGGRRVDVERFAEFTDTLDVFVRQARAWQPETPLFLIGHSMGGLISVLYVLDYQPQLAGVVLSGPAVKPSTTLSPLVVKVGKLLSRIWPTCRFYRLPSGGASRDPAVLEAYRNDPLKTPGRLTVRLGLEMFQAMQRVLPEAAQIALPLLIVQGEADRLVDPAGARQLYEAVSSSDKTLKRYPGLYHEVFNEPEHAQVLSDVEAWVEAQLSGAGQAVKE